MSVRPKAKASGKTRLAQLYYRRQKSRADDEFRQMPTDSPIQRQVKSLDRLTWLSWGFSRTTGVFVFFLLNPGMIELSNFNYHLRVTEV